MYISSTRTYFRLILSLQARYKSQTYIPFNLKIMPKDPKHIAEAQKSRLKIKDKSSKYVPARVTLQVLGTGAEGAPRSLYVFSDQARYLFNCGEGTQRLAHEHKMKLAKLEHIFVTQPVWKNMGGLPGTALTIQEVGVPQITLHGPGALNELFKATKKFVIMKNLKIKMADCQEDACFEDNVMTVKYVHLLRTRAEAVVLEEEVENAAMEELSELDKSIQAGNSSNMVDESTATTNGRKRRRSRTKSVVSNVSDDDTDYYAHESKIARNKSRGRSYSRNGSRSKSSSVSGSRSSSQSTVSQLSKDVLIETKERGIVMSYICRLQPRPGALNLDKCVNLGVTPGPLLGKLKNGNEIVLPNGKTVKPSDVCEPDDPGPVFLVIDCPSEEYINSLLTNTELMNYQSSAKNDIDLAYLVVHFSPMDVIKSAGYQGFIDSFSPSTRHIFLNDGNTCMGSGSVHRIQYKLNLLSKDIFPLLGDKGTEHISESEYDNLQKNNAEGNNKMNKVTHWDGTIQPNTFSSFHLRPKTGFDNSSSLKICAPKYISETMNIDGFTVELAKFRIALSSKRNKLHIKPFPNVLFLGTGSCIPNKTRNTSGILLQTSETSNILIDCGEGTYGQMVRFFGQDDCLKALAHTDAIYISHLHADHHIGLIGFLQGRQRARSLLKLPAKPVYLLAPKQILSWLHFYDLCFEDIVEEYNIVANSELLHGSRTIDKEMELELYKALDMSEINTCFVKHCPNAFGVAFVHKLGYKITYSGDTMPCESLVKLGMESDLLIHEATMEDELESEAVLKMHSTTTQAIEMGTKMAAKNIILTHFSQRYAKLPRLNNQFKDNIGIAFDNMQVKLDELSLLPLFYSPLKAMFVEHYEELEQKAVKRQLRQEREQVAIKLKHKQNVTIK